MRYLPNSADERRQMLETCGAASLEDLFSSLPAEVRLAKPLALGPGKSEYEILDYFRDQKEVIESGDMPKLERNYLEKHNAVNHTARALTEHGMSFVAARHLHHAPAREPVPA